MAYFSGYESVHSNSEFDQQILTFRDVRLVVIVVIV